MGQNHSADSLDARLDAVGHGIRREVLYELQRARGESDAVVRVASLAENDDSREVALRHRHLPKLATHGYVTIGPADERVEPGPWFDVLVPLLDHLASSHGAVAAEAGAVGRCD